MSAAVPDSDATSDESVREVEEARRDEARVAGRGGLAVAFAKLYFIVTGLVQQIALKAVLGLDGYGALSSALSIASVSYNPLVSTSIQGVSRAVAGAKAEERDASLYRTWRLHALIALVGGAGFFAFAGFVGKLVGAPHIVPALQALAGVFFLYGLYTPLVGALNGDRRFFAQAALDIAAATLRTVCLIAGAWWFVRAGTTLDGVEGASYGFIASAAGVLGIALFLVGTGRRGAGGPNIRGYLMFIGPLFLGQVLLNLLLQADLTLLRRFAAEAAVAGGLPLTAADPLVGAYRATQLYCFLPYQLLLAVTFILFPMLAAAHRNGDHAAVARYVRTGVRLALLLMGAMVSVTAGLPGPLIALVFGPDAAALGTPAMRLLSLGFGAFAIFGIFVTVLNSLKYERASAFVTAVAFALIVALCFLRVRGEPFGPELLTRTALATSIGLAAATLTAGVIVRKAAGAVVAPLSVLRVLGSMTLVILLARALPVHGKVMTLLASAALPAVYFALLVVSRELGREDWHLLRRVVSRGR